MGVTGEDRGGGEGRERGEEMNSVIKITIKKKVSSTFPTGQHRPKVGEDSNC